MTLNQKIMSVGLLSVLLLILASMGGLAIKDMMDRGNLSSGDSVADTTQNPPVSQEKDEIADLAAGENEPKSVSGKDSDDAESGEETSAELEGGEEAGWQTYRNNFYSIDYPASYKIAGERKDIGEVNFEINGFGAETVIFIAGGKKTLAFQGTWALIPAEDATDQKLLDTETVDMNGVRFTKKYWAIRQLEDGAWLTSVGYYGCSQEGDCFSMVHGLAAKGITPWEEKTGSQLADKTKIKTIVSIIKASKETDLVNFNNMFLTFRFLDKAAPPASASDKSTQWKEYIFEPLVGTADSTDRRLVGIRDDDTRDIIAASVKTTMGWNDLPGFYPNKVLFPPYAEEIYFTKYLSDSGSSSGMFALDVVTLKYRRLANVGQIYEDYNNYASIISPNKKLIASLGGSDLYILDLAADKATVIATAGAGEILNPAGGLQDFKWIDDNTVQYPAYKISDLSMAAQVRKAAVK